MSKKIKKILNTDVGKFMAGKFNLQESYPSLILGAIIVIILGLLVANYFTRRNAAQITPESETTQQTEQMAPAEPKAGSEYTIKENDSLSKIAEAVYGTQSAWPKIAQANNIATPNKILVGNKLQLPPKEEVEPAMEKAPEAMQGTDQTSYDVQEGDTFFTIAEKVYGNGSMWPKLHQANGNRRLPNGNPLVMKGTTIQVPR